MARVLVSQEVQRRHWAAGGLAGSVKVARGIIALDAVALVATDVLDVVVLPANHVPVDFYIHCDDLDSNGTPTLTLDAGFISGAPGDTTHANRVVGTEIMNNGTTAQAQAFTRATAAAFLRSVAQPVDRSIGFKVETAPATAVVRNGTFNVNRGVWKPGETYDANDYLILPNGVWMQCTTGGASGFYGQTEKTAPSQWQPSWNLTFGGTTTDGSVVWTCRSPIIGITLLYAPARDKL